MIFYDYIIVDKQSQVEAIERLRPYVERLMCVKKGDLIRISFYTTLSQHYGLDRDALLDGLEVYDA